MKWSWKIGSFRGIGVYVHATFLILIGFVVLSHWSQGHSLAGTLAGVGFIVVFFACVVAHEFGHALIFGNPFLLFIALFVWIGAAQEASMAQMKSALSGIPVARAMLTDFRTLSPEDTLRRAVQLLLNGSQHDFPVLDGDRVVGVLTRADLLVALAQRDLDSRVEDVMRREFETVDAAEMLETAFRRFQTCHCETLPILRTGALVGLVSLDNVGEFVAIRAALESAKASRRKVVGA